MKVKVFLLFVVLFVFVPSLAYGQDTAVWYAPQITICDGYRFEFTFTNSGDDQNIFSSFSAVTTMYQETRTQTGPTSMAVTTQTPSVSWHETVNLGQPRDRDYVSKFGSPGSVGGGIGGGAVYVISYSSNDSSACESGFAQFTLSTQMSASVRLQQWQNGIPVAGVAVPVVQAMPVNIVPVIESPDGAPDDNRHTGTAIANPNGVPVVVTVNLYSTGSNIFGSKGINKTITLPVLGHVAIFAFELFPEIKGDNSILQGKDFVGRFKITAADTNGNPVSVPVQSLGMDIDNGNIVFTSLGSIGQ